MRKEEKNNLGKKTLNLFLEKVNKGDEMKKSFYLV